MNPRVVRHRYTDPLDRIWTSTARRVGLRLSRSPEVYAATDGRGGLRIGTPETLDADDCLAQMVFHELCHSLIEGPEAFSRADWGLDNTGPRDVVREHACLRLQALLLDEYGLRRVLAPTTDFRTFYDRLGPDPLAPRDAPSIPPAILGWQRVERLPWAPHVRTALHATAAVVQATAPFADGDPSARGSEHGGRGDAVPELWSEAEAPPERHPLGFAPAPARESIAGEPTAGDARTCGECAWHYLGGRGRAVDRCRQADGARVQPDWPACRRWEDALDCQACGACCREAYHSISVERRGPAATRHPQLVVDRGEYLEMQRVPTPGGSRCVALHGGDGDGEDGEDGEDGLYHCVIYADRPRNCREFENAGAHCLTARRRVGLSR